MLEHKIKENKSDKTLDIAQVNVLPNAEKQRYDTKFTTPYAEGVDVHSLEKDLKASIKGEVRFDDGSRALYTTDASNYSQVPIGVVIPLDEEDIINTVKACRKAGAPILARGGGTSLAGQCCNVAVVMDLSKYYNKILTWNEDRKTVTIQTGIVLDDMRHTTEREIGLTFGPDPATHNHCTLGGMLGNNSCGVHSVMAQFEGNGARTSDNVDTLTVLTYDGTIMTVGPTSDAELEEIIKEGGTRGEIYQKLKKFRDKYAPLIRERFPNIPRRVSGYNLPELLPENGFNVARALVGSENTLVTILQATLKLIKNPEARSLLVLGYPSIFEAGNHIPEILKYKPIGLEGIDDLLISFMQRKGLNLKDLPLLPPGGGWLMVEFGGPSKEDSDRKAIELTNALKLQPDCPSMSLFDDPAQERMLWEIRESGLGATAWVPGEPMGAPGWEDSAVDPQYVGKYLKDLSDLFHKYGYKPSLYGHFGQGCVHCRVQFDLFSSEGISKYKQFTIEAAHLVVKYGGSLSGEHGDGQARGDLLEIMYGPDLVQAFSEFKEIWDPTWKMNPGKIVNTYGQLANFRFGTHYNPPAVTTHFFYANDSDNFANATIRCVGVGECRKQEGGTMCPSYMVTREEKHSTRGRAHMLFEMLEGNVIKDGWQDEHVKEALDLCLSCKGCKADCPVNVDIAMYKSEFLAHYYEKKRRPISAYAFGFIYRWARLASLAPRVANFFMRAPLISDVLKAAAGIAAERQLPQFADITFREWFKRREPRNTDIQNKQRVILWTDTFNNHFEPETLVAATHLLEAAGFYVVIPRKHLCCGRPLYDYGMLNTAKAMLKDILSSLRHHIENGVPIVGLEPGCVSVFRDELTALLHNNQDAQRLKSQTFTLAEFLEKYAPDFDIPMLRQKALVHDHCHHKAVMKTDPEKRILKKVGLDYQILNSGCCGMAGGFGYEKGKHYDVSIAAGERVLLPAVREAAANTIIVSDGFSCREQIKQETDRTAMHLAQVLDMALDKNDSEAVIDYPERKYVEAKKLEDPRAVVKTLFFAGIVGCCAVALALKFQNHKD